MQHTHGQGDRYLLLTVHAAKDTEFVVMARQATIHDNLGHIEMCKGLQVFVVMRELIV